MPTEGSSDNIVHSKPKISFEFFPPKTDEGNRKLGLERAKLAEYKPEFFSVTYGAGGSTRDHTFDVVVKTQKETNIPTAPHLSCIGDTRQALTDLIQKYKALGVNRIVALRGDLPSGLPAKGELPYARDLVLLIRELTGDHFFIEVAAYPEMHPQADNMQKDFEHFKQKVEAGASSAITQYFYNIDAYEYFLEWCQKEQIDIPIVPGVMPITNYNKLARFSDMCGAMGMIRPLSLHLAKRW